MLTNVDGTPVGAGIQNNSLDIDSLQSRHWTVQIYVAGKWEFVYGGVWL